MTMWLAQKGTQVAVVEAPGVRQAATVAAEVLRLPSQTREHRAKVRGRLPGDTSFRLPWRVTDWRGASLRPATEAEVQRFFAAHAQDRALSSRAKVKAVVR